MLTPGLASKAFHKLTVPEVIHLVRKSALKSIEWEGDIHIPYGREDAALDARKRTEDAGLILAGYGTSYRIGISEKEQAPFESLLVTAVALKAPTIRVWAGTTSFGKTDEATRKSVIRKTQKITALAAEVGITISIGFRRNTWVDHSDSALQLFKEIDNPNLLPTWQPPPPSALANATIGLRQLLPRLGNIYAVHSKSAAAPTLGADAELWQEFISLLRKTGRDHHLLIAGVKADSPDNLLADADLLRQWVNGS